MQDVVKTGVSPLAQGSFGEVWTGLLRGHPIAIKMIRVWAGDIDKILKARLHPILDDASYSVTN
jgi:hypothetical protein